MNNHRITPITELLDFDEIEQSNNTLHSEKYKEEKIEDYKKSDNTLNSPVSDKISDINVTVKNYKTEYEFQKIAEKIRNVYEIAAYLKQNDKDAYRTASNFFEHDSTILYIIIGILIITCLLLLKKCLNM